MALYEQIKNYNETIDKVSNALTECKNFDGKFIWCKGFTCEYIDFCKDIQEDIAKLEEFFKNAPTED